MMVEISKVWIQVDALAKGALGCRPIAPVVEFDGSQRIVSFRQCVVQAECLSHRTLCTRPVLVGRQNAIGSSERVIKRKPHIRGRIRRVQINRLLEIMTDPLVSRRKKLSPQMFSFEI